MRAKLQDMPIQLIMVGSRRPILSVRENATHDPRKLHRASPIDSQMLKDRKTSYY